MIHEVEKSRSELVDADRFHEMRRNHQHPESRQLARIEQKLDNLLSEIRDVKSTLTKGQRKMADDLDNAVTKIKASVKRIIDDAVKLLSQSHPNVTAAVTALNGLSADLDTESAAIEAAETDSSGNPVTSAG